ncbi:MAG: hypothetical protein KIT54_06675 [Phycisphaeraceae bacterium]|nr:hypothetical protein [Phycisphaeraceae bacterium]
MFTYIYQTIYCRELAQEVDPVHAGLFHATPISDSSVDAKGQFYKNASNLAPVFMAGSRLVVSERVLQLLRACCNVTASRIDLVWYEYDCGPGDTSFLDDVDRSVIVDAWVPDIVRNIASRRTITRKNTEEQYFAIESADVRRMLPCPMDLRHYIVTREDSILVAGRSKVTMSVEMLEKYGILWGGGLCCRNDVAEIIGANVWAPWFDMIEIDTLHQTDD